MTTPRLLVAGLGNIFLGDDAFGVEVAGRLRERAWPEGVRVVDFGIRGRDLAHALEGCAAAILVDATARGGAPGTLYVLEPAIDGAAADDLSAHALTPAAVLRQLSPASRPRWLRLVGCEPASLDEDGDFMGLSEPVSAAIDEAVRLVEALVRERLAEEGADA